MSVLGRMAGVEADAHVGITVHTCHPYPCHTLISMHKLLIEPAYSSMNLYISTRATHS